MKPTNRRDDYTVAPPPHSTAYLVGVILGWLVIGIAVGLLLLVLALVASVALWAAGVL